MGEVRDQRLALQLVQPFSEGLLPAATPSPCVLHTHSSGPYPLYCEEHHVIPRDWQDEFSPNPDLIEFGIPGAKVWDNRVIPCCRTGHGNIHFLLVRFMLKWESHFVNGSTVMQDESTINFTARQVVEKLRAQKMHINHNEVEWARAAMYRWHHYGLDLLKLCENGSYGRI